MSGETEVVKKGAGPYIKELWGCLERICATDAQGVSLDLNDGIDKAIDRILKGKAALRKIMVIGNGGSAAIAGHMQNDLCQAVGARAMTFGDTPLMTALSNDHGYECVYERPLSLWADEGDILIAVSSSGRSKNILDAVAVGKSLGCVVLTFSGFEIDNPLRALGEINFWVPSGDYGYVETTHAILTHLITDLAVDAQIGQGEGA